MSNERYGAVIKFRPGITEEEIAKAMNAIKDVLDLPATVEEPVYKGTDKGRRIEEWRTVRFTWRHLVQKYNPAHGEPVWYIP